MRAPSFDHIKIGVQIAVPRSAKDAVALLARAKGEPEQAVADWQTVDAKWVGRTVSKQAVFLFVDSTQHYTPLTSFSDASGSMFRELVK